MLKYDSFKLKKYILEPISNSDSDDIFELFSDTEHCKYFMSALKSKSEAEKLIGKINYEKHNNNMFNWGVYLKKNKLFNTSKGKLIGLILFEKSLINKNYSMLTDFCIAIIINPQFAHKGIGSIVLEPIVNYLIKLESFRFVSAWTSPYNYKSINLFKKLKFNFIGINASENLVFYKTNSSEVHIINQINNIATSAFVPISFSPFSSDSKYKYVYNGFPEIETERLLLTKFTAADAQDYQYLINQNDISEEFYGPKSIQDSINLVTYSFPKAFLENKYVTWAIKEKKTNTIIGLRNLYTDDNDDYVETQGFIGRNYRGRGFHQEGLKAIVNFTKKSGFSGIVANSSSKNETIKHILKKNGFKIFAPFKLYSSPYDTTDRIKYYIDF